MRGERGFAALMVLLLALAVGGGLAAALPRALSWYHAALVRHEAECLVSDLRELQQLSRLAARPFGEEASRYGVSLMRPELRADGLHGRYEIHGLKEQIDGAAGVPQLGRLKVHELARGVRLDANRAPFRFGVNGSTKTAGTFLLSHEAEPGKITRVVVDTVGRIRVEVGR